MTNALSFEQKLENYARLLVRVGVNLQPGGKLHLSAPVGAVELARLITREAYRAGAAEVDVRYVDEHLDRSRLTDGQDGAVAFVPEWFAEERLHKIADGYAFLTLTGNDPDLLGGVNAERIGVRSKALAIASRPVGQKMSAFAVNWSIGAMPVASWARKVFPGVPDGEAVARLWDAIFTVSRADEADPVAAWDAHLKQLARVRDHLNGRRYAALQFTGPGTDLTVGLADGHVWAGGAWAAQNGVVGVPNLPTDEVFTAPHRDRVDGVATATKPLIARGTTISGIRVRFEGGRVVEATSDTGQDVLTALLDTDEGARHLGEVALVPASAPVARTGHLYYDTLFDENAAIHLALGRAYDFNFERGKVRAEDGGNDSLIHVDWMIGSAQVDVDGVRADGEREPVMRGGEWAF
ncbi:aminopeptidase [Deinococcus maricopensis]|nr:aminopeptidase [Deinococcus maricopensis]